MTAPTYPTQLCKSCGAAVIWAISENKLRSSPVNPEPVKDGNIQLVERPGQAPLARVLKVADRFGKRDLRVSHFVDCPQSREWRTRRAKTS